MKSNFLKKFLSSMIIIFITSVIFTTYSNANTDMSEESFEEEYVSITNIDLSTQETSYFNVSTKNIGNTLEDYPGELDVSVDIVNDSQISTCGIVGFNDERTRVIDTTQYPYSAIAHLVISYRDGNGNMYTGNGTGFMIGANKLLTAAHCVKFDGFSVVQIEVIPAQNGINNKPFGTTSVTNVSNIFVPTAFVPIGLDEEGNDEDSEYDWAVLKLNGNIGNQCRWLSLQVGGYSFGTEGDTFHTSGYPGHNPNDYRYSEHRTEELDTYRIYYQYHTTGIIKNVYTRYFTNTLDALPGQSGSPIYFYDASNTPQVVGILSRSGPYTIVNGKHKFNYNCATKINYTIINTASSF